MGLQEVEVVPPHTNTPVVAGRVLRLGWRKPLRPCCRDGIVAAIHRLMERTGEEVFTVTRVFTEMGRVGTSYQQSAVYQDNAADEGSRPPQRDRP